MSRGAAQQTLADGTVTDAGPRVALQREAVTEWFQNTAAGLEHGYTIKEQPRGDEREPVRLEIAPSEGWHAVPAFEKQAIALEMLDGTSRIVWRGLRAWDAAGNAVRAWFERSSARREFSIMLADAGAMYPVTVDPVYNTERLSGVPVQGGAGSLPQSLAAFNGLLYFSASDGVTGSELWKSDGTPAGTVLVKDIEPGSEGSFIEGMKTVGSALYFRAYRADTGPELWKSDGTESGTVPVKDINPGAAGSYPAEFTPMGGFVYFRAHGPEGYELWRTDGSEAGTTLVKDIHAGAFNNSFPEALTVLNGVLYFFAETSSAGTELWASDGTAPGTIMVKDILPGSQGQFDVAMSVFNSKLYFGATDGVNGRELWQSNGTTAGTVMLKNIYDPGGSSWPEDFTAVGSTLYFLATDIAAGTELWKTDGTAGGTALVKDIRPGVPGSNPGNLTAHGVEVFFKANDGTNGRELWHSSDSEIGTNRVDLNPTGSAFSDFDDVPMLSLGDTLIFAADNGFSGRELWRSHAFNGTVMVRDINSGAGGSLNESVHFAAPSFTAVGSQVYFAATNGVDGIELWKTDATTGGTVQVKDIAGGGYTNGPRDLVMAGSTLYFTSQTDAAGRELWKSDGTPGGTALVKDIQPGAAPSFIAELTPDGSAVWFAANDGANGTELWRSDGTPGGTAMVRNFGTGTQGLNPSQLKLWGSTLLFRADDGGSNFELWKSNGTSAGTVLVKDINSSVPGALPGNITPAGSIAYFTANDGNSAGLELWKTDGTSGGTSLVRDIYPGLSSSDPGYLTMLGSTLFFSANDGSGGAELWKSDGSSGGTVQVKNINVASFASSQPQQLKAVGSTLYFSADDGTDGRELWKSDGSNAGTVPVRNINQTVGGSSNPESFTAAGGILYFRATNGNAGYEIWRTDGSSGGTTMVKDLFPGTSASDPRDLCAFDGRLFFVAASDLTTGRQIWSTDGTSDGTVRAESLGFPPPHTYPQFLTPGGPRLFFASSRDRAGTLEMQLSSLTASAPPPTSSLLAWWNFDNAANPAVSADLIHGYSGVFLDGAHFTPAAGGRTGSGSDRAADFTLAVSDRMEVAAATWLNAAGAVDKLTVSFWQKMTQYTTGSSFHLVSPSSELTRGAQAHCPWSDGYYYWDTGGYSSGAVRFVAAPPGGFSAFTWHHYAFVKDGDTKQVWIDGQLAGSGTNTANLSQDMTKLFVGAHDPAIGPWQMQGYIDDFAIYGTALSPGDIALLNSGTPPDQIGAPAVPDIPAWAAGYGLTGGNTAASANPSLDGLNNLLKYAFNLNPSQPDLRILTTNTGTAGLPLITFTGSYLRFEFLRRKGAAITYTAQKASAPAAWQPATAAPVVTSIDAAWERVVILAPLTAALNGRAFGRVLVSQP